MQGKTVSHFEILELLGSGGMGVVYRARDLKLGRAVALKFLPASVAGERGDQERFLREARAASCLNHPHICTVHEIGEDGEGQLFLCMEICEGETLKARLRRGPLPLDDALDVAVQIADALACAHRAGIVHRDVKPANIVVNDRNEAKILDFGLAQMTEESRLTRIGTAIGTVAYMSPEQARGEKVDHRSDLWSLGAVLYEMLTGLLPFPGTSDLAVLNTLLTRDPEPLAKVRPGLPPDLDRLFVRLLAKDPAARTSSAPVLEQELRLLRKGLDSQLETDVLVPPAPTRRLWTRRRFRLAAGLVGLAALAALAVAIPSLTRDRAPQRLHHNLAVLPFSNLTGDPAREYFGDGMSSVLINQLSNVPSLNLVSRSEASSYKGSRKGARQIAKELGAQEILEGQVVEAGERVRVNASLVDGETGFVVWSRILEGARSEIFHLQDRLAREVAQALSLPLNAAERQRLARGPTGSVEAYDVYLRARSLLDDVDHPENLDSASELFRKALELDPGFALAHAGLSETLTTTYRRDRDPALVTEARRQAERALAIDPNLPDALIALAAVDRSTGRIQESIGELRRLVAFHPELDTAYLELAGRYEDAGDLAKAESTLRQAIAIRPDYWSHWNELGTLLLDQDDFAGAREAFEKAIAAAPSEVSRPLKNLAALEMRRGDFAAAIKIYERIPHPTSDPVLANNIGTAYFSAGQLDEAEKYFRLALRLQPRNHAWHDNLADLFRRRGKTEAARAEYRTAAQLAGKDLEVNPGNENIQLWRAVYLADAGACGDAVPLARHLEASLQPSAENSWFVAQAYAVCGQRAPAIEAIRRAVEKGHPPAAIRSQDDFKSLWNDPTIKRLTSAVPPAPGRD
jgi:serine/threonine protein kinase/tetratricopeptide (TPR) repeat protein